VRPDPLDHLDRPLPLARAARTGDTRAPATRVDTGPNAPLLIRLVRYPFALSPVKLVRGTPLRSAVGNRPRAWAPRVSTVEVLADAGTTPKVRP
jgi:hypothetical protein